MLYAITFTVRRTIDAGNSFPFDMLRYDSCYPVREGELDAAAGFGMRRVPRLPDERDSEYAMRLAHSGRHVKLRTVARHKSWTPTAGRWLSFGWEVESESISGERV